MKSIRLFAILGFIAGLMLYNGCKDNPPSGPASGLGGVTVTKYVAVGNSLTAGFQSNALFQSGQMYSFPNLIAQQLNNAGANLGTFQMPIYSDPGNPDPATGKAARLEILSLTGPVTTPLGAKIYGPVILPAGLTPGAPANLGLPRPYDNLGVPGAILFDFLDTTDFATKAGPPRNNPLFQLVLRQAALGKSVLAQATALNPDLITFWFGANDVLGFATSGGTYPPSPTSSALFAQLYGLSLGALRASLPNAKIVVANIPDVRVLPFFNTVGPRMASNFPAGVYLRYQLHGRNGPDFDSTRFTEANPPLITLTGSAYAIYLGCAGGQGGGKWYQDHSIDPTLLGIDTTQPFGFSPLNPWPDALVLDASEQATAAAAVSDFNNTINTVAAADRAFVVDINAFLGALKANGFVSAGQLFTADYIQGGVFSLDGVHPSARGQGLIANQFIAVMNSKLGMNLPYVDVSALPGIPAPVSKIASTGNYPIIPPEAFKDLQWLWPSD